MLGLKLSGKKKQSWPQNAANVLNRERKKLILENIKTNNSGKADKPRVSLARENRPDTFLRKNLFQWQPNYCPCCASARRECLTWGRYLTLFRIISELGQRYRTEQLEGSVNYKETPSRPTNPIYPHPSGRGYKNYWSARHSCSSNIMNYMSYYELYVLC